MTGTLLNIITVVIGSLIGLFVGNRLPERIHQTVVAGIGLFTASLGVSMFMDTNNPVVVLLSLLVGGIIGEALRIETRLENFGGWLQARFSRQGDAESARGRFIKGFLTASLVFCVGPLTILGSIQDGLTGDYQLLAIKSTLDGFAAIAFAASLGIGVLFSILVILVFQGGLSLLAGLLTTVLSGPMLENEMIPELSAVGGVLLLGLAVSSLLEIKKIRVANFLPALLIAPILAYLFT